MTTRHRWARAAAAALALPLLAAAAKKGFPADVAPDIEARLARLKTVRMTSPAQTLSARERRMLAALVDASREGGSIFWRQTDPLDIPLLKSLRASSRRADPARPGFPFPERR